MASPSPDEVRLQLQRIYRYRMFRGAIRRQLLEFLVDQWQVDGGKNLKEKFIAEQCLREEESFEEDRQKFGYPKTRANLGHLRKYLREYFDTEGYADAVVIKLNTGSYVPQIDHNPVTIALPLRKEEEQLILRIKTLIDGHTLAGVLQALQLMGSMGEDETDARICANVALLGFAMAPLFPFITNAAMYAVDKALSMAKEKGVMPWECSFSGAAKACCEHDWKKALSLFKTAIDNSQGEAMYFWWYTSLLASVGRLHESIQILKSQVEHFARRNIAIRTDLALLQVMAGLFIDAEDTLADSMSLVPASDPLLACYTVMALEAQDRLELALQYALDWIRKLVETGRNIHEVLTGQPASEVSDMHIFSIGMYVLVSGRLGNNDAELYLDAMVERKRLFDTVSSVEIAIAMVGVGRYDDAVLWLNRAAFEEHDPYTMLFHIFPPLRHLRGHPGFSELLEKLQLPQR